MYSVMVVENDKDLAELLRLCLTISGVMKVYVATSVEDALRTYGKKKVHALLCDFDLGDGTADELIARLGKRAPKVKILLSGYDIDPQKYPGFIEYLVKPIDCRALRDNLTHLLARRFT